MSVQVYIESSQYGERFILHGNDTDVSWVTFIHVAVDKFLMVSYMADDEDGNIGNIQTRVLSDLDLDKEYMMQLGTPMQYMSEKDYGYLTRQNEELKKRYYANKAGN